jgi:TolB protein
MRFSILLLAFASLCAVASFSTPAVADAGNGMYIKVGDANLKKSLMAIPPFQMNGAKSGLKAGKDMYDVLRNDLEVSGYFEFIKPAAYEGFSNTGLRPAGTEQGGFNFASWTQIGTEFLIRVGFHVIDDRLTVDTYSYYVPQQKLVLNKTYKGTVNEARILAHTFANDLIKELTGQRASFLSKIVTSRSTRAQEKEIFIMDWDGANQKQMTFHGSISQSPTWSYDGQMIAYSEFAYHPNEKTRNMDLFTYDLSTGKRLLVSYRRGINSGASFTPDGKGLLLTISNGGNPDIYRMTLDGRNLTPLTHAKNGEMFVEPAMSPDGKKIAFSTTKSGRPMIYVMNADGSEQKRLTFAGEYNSTPSWSPDGKKIVFAGLDSDHYDIFTMDADGGNLVRLTSAKKPSGKFADNEDPTFSPDGRQILFRSNRTGKYQLYIVSVDGEVERRITFDQNDYFKPRWSPSFE